MENKETVNHPSHYNREGALEAIDEMVLIFGIEAVKSFCLCNAWKYRYRAADKNGEEDLKKSDWYIQKYKELSESKRKSFIADPQPITIHPTPLSEPCPQIRIEPNDWSPGPATCV